MDMPVIRSVQYNDEGTKACLSLIIEDGLDVFKGHFEGAPIVPGVVQIHWVLQLAKIYQQSIHKNCISGMEMIKFQHVMVPGLEVNLELEAAGNKLLFKYTSGKVNYSSGKVVMADE